ncbi:GPP34 family phosphoprotein [Amycolatopsis ultiminotia]|uniref:GPP34 family phosphoprotein n=1 Tax=Amycolatopsis ultiminotia TaxID=543629 RepID=A0ABP6XLV7_9PSEU
MTLSLPAGAYLLACDPDRGRIRNRRGTALLIRAAAATDLVLRDRLRDTGGHAESTGLGPTGDLVLDDLLTEAAERGPWSWRALLRRDAMDTLRSLELQMSAAGLLSEQTTALLQRKVLVADDLTRVQAVHERATAALTAPLSEVDASDAALVSLAAAAQIGVRRRTTRRYSARLDELAERAGPMVPVLRKLVRSLRAARIAAASSGGG